MMKSTKKCPLFSTISLATDGDEVAIEKILNHYDAYISKASLMNTEICILWSIWN
jgi:hypothetical protein